MDEATEDKVYQLVEIVERQQTIVQNILEQIVSERDDLQKEKTEWAEQTTSLAHDVHGVILETVEGSLSRMMQTGSSVLEQLSEPLTASISQVLTEVKEAEAQLTGLLHRTRVRLLLVGLVSVAGLAFLWWLATSAVAWWDASAIGALQVEKVQVQTDLARLKADRETWIKAGMLAKIVPCGEARRPCVPVDESVGKFGDKGQYRVLKGQ